MDSPFFASLYDKRATLHIYGPKGVRQNLKQTLHTFFSKEFFPIPLKKMPARLCFHTLEETRKRIAGFEVESFPINHPGKTLGYIISNQKRRIAYLTDHEPIDHHCHLKGVPPRDYTDQLHARLDGIDLLIHDAQFTDAQYKGFKAWGHAPWAYAIRLAKVVKAGRLVLFHHAPDNSDAFLRASFKALQAKMKKTRRPLHVTLAREGESITL